MNSKNGQEIKMIRGDRYRRTHKASIIGILGSDSPEIFSRGSLFYNQDRWTLQFFTKKMCEWAKKNPGCVPVKKDISQWVEWANKQKTPRRQIVIANTPTLLPIRTAMALTGGAYHEAFHTKYSCRRPVTTNEMAKRIIPRWAKVKDWSKLTKALLNWSNVVEDIRIEQCGRKEFEGTFVKLCDLQDYIIQMESKSRETNNGPKSSKNKETLSIIFRAFRDFGLGYNTEIQRDAITSYKKKNLNAVKMVSEGPLRPLVDSGIRLKPTDDLECLMIAMDVLSVISDLAEQNESEEENKNEGTGDGETKCPQCGADADKLVVRPKSDGCGGKVKGKGICTCTVCGYQEEVDVQKKEKSKNGQQQSDNKKNPKFEGFDEEDFDDSDSGGLGDRDSSDPDKKSDNQESNNSKSGKDLKSDDYDQESDNQGSGNSNDDSNDDSEGSLGNSGSDKQNSENESDGDSKDDSSNGAGGYNHNDDTVKGKDWSDLASEAYNETVSEKDLGVMNNNSALEEGFSETQNKEDSDVKRGEKIWKPYNPELDEVKFIEPSDMGKEHDQQQSSYILNSVKEEAAFFRARLRTVIRSIEMTNTFHGVPKGHNLSNRFLVDSKISLKAKKTPKRAYYIKGQQIDMTMAAAIVIDQSGSMNSKLKDATRMLVAISEPLDSLGCAVMVCGFRNGNYSHYSNNYENLTEKEYGKNYHRNDGVTIDIFKAWYERFKSVQWRFANIQSTGSTPMSDGIEYALQSLSIRDEAHRFMFVITDGQPDDGHTPIIKRQIRLAREAGIYIIGVGVGVGAQYVNNLFDDSVYSANVKEIPKMLIAKLNELADIRGGRRGKRVKKTA